MDDETSRCDVLDRLEEAVASKRPVAVELTGGARFIDGVRDVVTEHGEDVALFERQGRIAVREIRRCDRAPGAAPPQRYDDKA